MAGNNAQPCLPTVIVLAADQSYRFQQSGSTVHKLDALLGGMAVLERVLRTVAASGLNCHIMRPDALIAFVSVDPQWAKRNGVRFAPCSLIPGALVPRTFSIVFGGSAIAMAVSTLVETYLGAIIGWLGIFLMAGGRGLGIIALSWLLIALPSMTPSGQPV